MLKFPLVCALSGVSVVNVPLNKHHFMIIINVGHLH